MPLDTWAQPPTLKPHGYGYSIPVAVTEQGSGTEGDPTRHEGIRIEVRSLNACDIEAGIAADPDAGPEHLAETLGLALDQTASGIQPQIDDIIDTILEA